MIAPLMHAQQDWVERTFATLSLEDKVGQTLVPMLTPHSVGDMSPGEWAKYYRVGGGHVFGGTLAGTRDLIAQAQSGARVPLLISGDLDKGGGDRLREGTMFPYQMALGAAADEELAYAMGRSIAVESRAAGFNWTFSPIVDLVAHPGYQRLAASVGSDPALVSRIASAEVRGIQDHGLAACAKHFPGDGFDDRDQHVATIINPLTRETWQRTSAVPFQACIDAGVWSIMNASIRLPSVDSECPSIISRKLTSDLLRDEMKFEGVIVTDALNMGGLSCLFPHPERYARAFQAGNDVLLFVDRLEITVPFLIDCFKSGRLSQEQLDSSVRRILTLKARVGLHERVMACEISLPDASCQHAATRLAEASVTLVCDRQQRLPIAPQSRVAHVVITSRLEEFDPTPFESTLCAAGCQLERFVHPAAESMYDRVATGDFDAVITSLFFPLQWGWGTVQAHGAGLRSLLSCYWLAHPVVTPVFLSFCGPMHLLELPHLDPFIVTYGEAPCSQDAVARMLVGQIPFQGKVPVPLEKYIHSAVDAHQTFDYSEKHV